MHMDFRKNCRGIQLGTKGRDIGEANLLSNVKLKDISDQEMCPSAGEMELSWKTSEEELGYGMAKWEIISVNPT